MASGFLLYVFLTACSGSIKDQEFADHAKSTKSGLQKTREIGALSYRFQYLPAKLLIIQEHLQDAAVIENRKRQLQGTVWFKIAIGVKDARINPLKYQVNDIEIYNDRVDYFLNHAAQDIEIGYGTKTLKPMSYLFENNYGLTEEDVMLVGFDLGNEQDLEEDIRLSFRDNVFRNGIIIAHFSKKDINNINHL